MALESADKIFLDVDEEINFVIEKIFNSPKNRVILIAPQNATLLSSLVSIKILVNRVIKLNKLVILVTEDKFGLRLAAKAGLVALEKVSSVTPDQWEAAQIKKQNLSDQYNTKKEQLLSARDETLGQVPDSVNLIIPKNKQDLVDIMQSEAEIEQSEAENSEPENVINQEIAQLQDEPEVLPIQRVRREPKLIQAGAFTLLAGGDIQSQVNSPRANIDSAMETEDEQSKKPLNGYTGKDWTRATRKGESTSWFSKLTGNTNNLKRTSLGVNVPVTNRFYNSPLFWVFIAAIIGGILGLVYILVNNVASADVRLTVKTLQIPVQGKITALSTVQTSDISKLTIPAKIVTQSVNGSDSGTAGGSSERGQKAGGIIEIWNKKITTDVTIPAGTAIISPQTGLKYILLEAVTVKGVNSTVPIPEIEESDERRVEAENFGAQYNYTPMAGDARFKVGNYNTEDLNAYIKTAISGGTSEKFTSVSEEDLNGVQDKVKERLLKQGIDKIKASLDSSFTILAGTEEIKIIKASSVPEVGGQATKFDYSLQAEVTILVVAKPDLQSAVSELVKRDNTSSEIELAIDSSSPESLAEITKIEGGVTFTISADSNLKYQIDTAKVSNEMGGKNLKDAVEYLNSIAGVERASLLYTPDFIPDFLRMIPRNASQIKITVN